MRLTPIARHSRPLARALALAPRLIVLCLIVVLVGAPAGFAAPAPIKKKFLVVIDPGHGGVDLGTVYDDGKVRIAEKEITLSLAHQTAQELRVRGIPVTLTRERDQEMPLDRRTSLANRLDADVFISIHMNSTPGPAALEAQGIETFILNNTTDETSRRLARLENMVLNKANIGSPEEADVALILRDLRLDANLAESKRLACGVQQSLISTLAKAPATLSSIKGQPRLISAARDRGVKQALFYVLLGAEMPSILIEAGFLSHAKDRALVLSAVGRKLLASAIAKAVEDFRKQKNSPQAQLALSRCKVH